jgi:putative transposase
MKKRFSEEQINRVLAGGGCRPASEGSMPEGWVFGSSYYLWRSKFGGMSVPDAKRLKELEIENHRLKKLLAESLLENEVTREVLRKKW